MPEFLKELSRRNVFRVAAAYVIVGWIVLQVGTLLFGNFGAPDWVAKVFTSVIILGFPIAMLLTWAFEMTPGGTRRTDSGAGESSLQNGRIDIGLMAVAALLVGVTILSPAFMQQSRTFSETLDVQDSGTIGDGATQTQETPLPTFSLAVLPFNNLSDERELGWIADGMSEDITTRFASNAYAFVAARNSAFAYKGQSPDVRVVGRELGVRYVIEGSLRKIDDSLRITAQVIDTATGAHIWAANYDQSLLRLAKMQAEVIDAIVGDGGFEMFLAETARLEEVPQEDRRPRDMTLLAQSRYSTGMSLPVINRNITMLEEGVSRYPGRGDLRAELALAYCFSSFFKEPSYAAELFEKAESQLSQALKLAPNSAWVLNQGVWVKHAVGKFEEARFLGENKRSAFPKHVQATALPATYRALGRYEDAIAEAMRWLELAPARDGARKNVLQVVADSFLGKRDFEEAEASFRMALEIPRNPRVQRGFIVALAHQGKFEEARTEAEIYKALPSAQPADSIRVEVRRFTIDDDFLEMYMEGLRLAGIE